MFGQMLAHKASDFFGELMAPLSPVLQDHEGLNRFGAGGIWHTDRSCHHHSGGTNKGTLYPSGPNTIPATRNDIIGAALKPEIALFITGAQIARQQPVIR